MTEEGRKEITFDELAALKQSGGSMEGVQVQGICSVIDKDGKVKGKMKITSIDESQEDQA